MKKDYKISRFDFTPNQLSEFEQKLRFEKIKNFIYIFKIKVLYREFYQPFQNDFFSK